MSIKEFRLKNRKKAIKQHMDIDKGSPPQTVIKVIDIPYSSLVGGQSFPSTPTSERQQTIKVSSSTKVTKEKEEIVFDTFREIKIRNEIIKKNTYA